MQRVIEHGGQRLPLGGINGYKHIRGKQGKGKDKFQGVSPKKMHRTRHCGTALDAALAYAQMMEDVELGLESEQQQDKKTCLPLASPATTVKPAPMNLCSSLPCVAVAPLSQQQAAAASARGVAVAMAEPMEDMPRMSLA